MYGEDTKINRLGTGSYSDYNPGIFAAPVAAQLGGYVTQLNSYEQAFINMDTYMMMTSSQRTAMKMRNKIASLENARYDDTKSMYDYAAGVGIDSDPLHAITIEPGIKIIGNLKNGWQPYAGVSMVFNIMDRTRFQANDISLPNFSINPFVKYGVGVRKTWGERLTGHFQTYFTNGGRNGVGLSASLRWAIGKEGVNEISDKTPELKPTKITLYNHK